MMFTFSSKMRFALQASIAVAIAYVLPIAQGWSTQSYTAAIAVMTIASTSSRGAALHKGLLRIGGTILGAMIGMILIANFAQDRVLYLSLLGCLIFVILYLARA